MFTEDQPCPKNLDHDQLCLLATEYCFQTLWPQMQDIVEIIILPVALGYRLSGVSLCAT